MGAIGAADDLLKLVRGRSLGLTGWQKIGLTAGAAAGLFLLFPDAIPSTLQIPFTAATVVLPSWALAVLAVVVFLAATNAVNFTDGLDGLAAGVVILVLLGFLALAPDAADLAYLLPLVGALAGYLWVNAPSRDADDGGRRIVRARRRSRRRRVESGHGLPLPDPGRRAGPRGRGRHSPGRMPSPHRAAPVPHESACTTTSRPRPARPSAGSSCLRASGPSRRSSFASGSHRQCSSRSPCSRRASVDREPSRQTLLPLTTLARMGQDSPDSWSHFAGRDGRTRSMVWDVARGA